MPIEPGAATERFYGLTGPATAAAWVVTYADHAPPSRTGIAAQGLVASATGIAGPDHERVPDLVTLALNFLNADRTAQTRRN